MLITAIIGVNRVLDRTVYSFIKITPVKNPQYKEFHVLDSHFKKESGEVIDIPNGIVS